MTNEGGFLEGRAMRSSGAATGTRSVMPAYSISTTTFPTTSGTTSASADPRQLNLDAGHAHGRQSLGRNPPEAQASKARHIAQPGTVAGPSGAAAEHGGDFLRITGIDNLWTCWQDARRGKYSARIQDFAADPLHYLNIIQQRLRADVYTFGPYRTFTVREKKFRDVVDAPMKDRVVHWMLYRYLLPIWERRFIHDTFGNLPGRGTHAAIKRLADFCRQPGRAWALQLDISKYFYSIPHSALKARALRYIGDQRIRRLLVNLIDSWSTDGRYDHLFPEDGNYRQTPAKGMPIGNLTSQLFANIYLNDFDHWMKETLRTRCFIRYVDDMVVLGESPDQLQYISDAIRSRLEADGLTIHPRKIRIAPVRAGIPFLGYVVYPCHISAGQYIRHRYHRRLRQHEQGQDRTQALQSYRAMLNHTGSTRNHPDPHKNRGKGS